MDGYPYSLAPEFDDGGGVKTPFEKWWPRVKDRFSNVPENVARYWLHEHWGRSPYRYLKSSVYTFRRVAWPSAQLFEFRSTFDDFDPACNGCIAKGKQLVTIKTIGKLYPTAEYMLEHRNFPAPIIVLDNHDDHANNDYPQLWKVPDGFVLIEGHTRFNIATYLQTIGRLNETVDVWLMNKISH